MYNVLVVDDSEILRRTIKRSKMWGEASGFAVTGEAGDGLEALEKMKQNHYDMVITDIKMPRMDGIELLEAISKNRLCPYVVLLSDFTEYGYARKGILFGAFDYIGKPMQDTDLSLLLNRIKEKLDSNKGPEQTVKEIEPQDVQMPTIKCFGRFEFSVGNNEIKFSTHKAREIFAYILCNNYRQISRDELIGIFFNTGDEKKDANNLRVTLFRIRQTLFAANISKEHILIKDDYSVKIAPKVCDITDLLTFINMNKIIDKSTILEANSIVDSIRGELIGDIDALWAAELRQYVAVEIENIMIKIAMYYTYSAFKPLKAEYTLIKLVELNPLSEVGHLALLDLCLKTNNRGKYLYYYRRYRECIKKDLDCEPESKYKDYYDKFSG